MKIKFNPNLDFQAEAISSISDIFEGQEVCRTNFTVEMETDSAKSAFA